MCEEYVGLLNTNDATVSITHTRSPAGWEGPAQHSEFHEYAVTLKGLLRVEHADGKIEAEAGQSVRVEPGEEVIYSTPFKLSAQSRNNYRGVLSVLFSYAVSRGYCPANPIFKTGKAKVVDKPVEVLTPDQTRRLLETAEPDMIPYIAIGAFAGLRPAEIERLDWREVRLDRNFIEVSAAKSKTGAASA